jgi:hypothetical protein
MKGCSKSDPSEDAADDWFDDVSDHAPPPDAAAAAAAMARSRTTGASGRDVTSSAQADAATPGDPSNCGDGLIGGLDSVDTDDTDPERGGTTAAMPSSASASGRYGLGLGSTAVAGGGGGESRPGSGRSDVGKLARRAPAENTAAAGTPMQSRNIASNSSMPPLPLPLLPPLMQWESGQTVVSSFPSWGVGAVLNRGPTLSNRRG